MLYWLSNLRELISPLNVLRYITVRSVGAGVTAFLVCVWLTPRVVRWLSRHRIGQQVRHDVAAGGLPEFHADKAGTPTMGGVLMVGAILLSACLWGNLANPLLRLALAAMAALSLVGWWDDYLKLRDHGAHGLSMRVKLIWQALIGAAVGWSVVALPPGNTLLEVPFARQWSCALGWWYVPFAALVIAGSSNAVNLTDGLDGLASGCLAMVGIAYGILAYVTSHATLAHYLNVYTTPLAGELSILCAALVGAALGFLWFNAYPANLFMGDTGAIGLGGALGVVAVYTKKEFLLMLVGGIFVVEALSVILQVASFRYRGQRRVFLMAPIHHHFQMKGWAEPKVTVRFWIVGALLALLSVATLKLR